MKTHTLQVNVTRRDIKTGISANCKKCPVARAIARRLRPGTKIRVEPRYIAFEDRRIRSGFERVYEAWYLPREVTQFIFRFDIGRRVRPFSFCVELPKAVLKIRA